MSDHEIKIKVPYLNRIRTIFGHSLKDRQSPPVFTVKKLKRQYLGEFKFSIIRKNIVVGHATTLTDAICFVREQILYSDWSDELSVH